MSKRYLALVSIGYGGGVLILTEIASFYTTQITDLIYSYNFEFFLEKQNSKIICHYFNLINYN